MGDKPGRESPDTRRPSTLKGKASAHGEGKGHLHPCGTRSKAISMREKMKDVGPEVLAFSRFSDRGKRIQAR